MTDTTNDPLSFADDGMEEPHQFVPFDANPTICRTCGAIKPMPCFRLRSEGPPLDDIEPTDYDLTHDPSLKDRPSTLNEYLLGYDGRTLSVMRPPVDMSADQALRFAAWLVVTSESMRPAAEYTFQEYYEAVRNT